MERFVIEQFGGVNRNAVEGVTLEPERLSGVKFKRSGGYIAAGERDQNWLGAGTRDLVVVLMESSTVGGTEYTILLESAGVSGTDSVATEWRPSEFLGTAEPIAYDESGLALFESARFWTGSDLTTMMGASFVSSEVLTLAPKVGALAAIRYTDSGYIGGAYYFDSGVFTSGDGPSTASSSTTGTTDIPAATYEFKWIVESPTDNGLVVHAIGESSVTVGSAVDSITLTVNNTYSEGTLTRFYYRDSSYVSTESMGFERYAIHVSSGTDNPVGKLEGPLPDPFVPTEEVIVNFAPGRVEAHNGRMWGKATDYPFTPLLPSSAWRSSSLESYSIPASDYDPNPHVNPEVTLVYSDIGSVNRGTNLNFIRLSPTASESITGLASTPAGLLVFMENETFLVRGDPATSDVSVQRLSGTLGNDSGVIPGKLSGVVFPIYQGEVWAVTLGGGDVDFGGGLVNISRPIYLPDDPFVQVVGEPSRNDVIVRSANGRVFRMDTESRAWINNQFDEVSGLSTFIPSPAGGSFGTRYVVDGFMEVVNDSALATPIVKWDALDMGDKNAMKLWRRIEVFTSDSGAGTPTLSYAVRGDSGSVTGLDQGRGRWVFTFPRGIVGTKADLEFTFEGATGDFVLEPPVVIEYAPRYRER